MDKPPVGKARGAVDPARGSFAVLGNGTGHATRQSMEIYSRLALADAHQRYDDVIGNAGPG